MLFAYRYDWRRDAQKRLAMSRQDVTNVNGESGTHSWNEWGGVSTSAEHPRTTNRRSWCHATACIWPWRLCSSYSHFAYHDNPTILIMHRFRGTKLVNKSDTTKFPIKFSRNNPPLCANHPTSPTDRDNLTHLHTCTLRKWPKMKPLNWT